MIVVAAVITREGRVLACQRNRSGKFPLKWEFPGGKAQPGETPEVALERELNEELGVKARIGAEIYRTQHQYADMPEPVELIFFEARVETGKIRNLIFEQLAWMEPEKLRGMDFLEADREFVEKLANRKFTTGPRTQNAGG